MQGRISQMAVAMKEKSFSTLVLVVIVGILIGSYCNLLVRTVIPGQNNVVKNFFTTNITFGIGSGATGGPLLLGVEDVARGDRFPDVRPLVIDLSAVKFQLGFQLKLSFLSIVGIFLSLYFFRWYK